MTHTNARGPQHPQIELWKASRVTHVVFAYDKFEQSYTLSERESIPPGISASLVVEGRMFVWIISVG